MLREGMFIAERYEIIEKIGSGGMSDVYKAKCHKLNRMVAVKVLKQEFSENANFVAKFHVEAQAAAGLMHPNIVNVYDVGEEDGIHYIVMELVEGITLKKYIEKKARLSVKEATSIAIQVSMGIEAAHNNNIIHRDIKPQNIIISKERFIPSSRIHHSTIIAISNFLRLIRHSPSRSIRIQHIQACTIGITNITRIITRLIRAISTLYTKNCTEVGILGIIINIHRSWSIESHIIFDEGRICHRSTFDIHAPSQVLTLRESFFQHINHLRVGILWHFASLIATSEILFDPNISLPITNSQLHIRSRRVERKINRQSLRLIVILRL